MRMRSRIIDRPVDEQYRLRDMYGNDLPGSETGRTSDLP